MLFCPPIAPLFFFQPTSHGAIPPTLRNTVVVSISYRNCKAAEDCQCKFCGHKRKKNTSTTIDRRMRFLKMQQKRNQAH